MRVTLTIFGCMLLVFSCTPDRTVTIDCRLDGLQNDSALIAFVPLSNEDNETIDTVAFKNGRFTCSYQADELHEVVIIPFDLIYTFENGRSYPLPSSRIHFFLDSLDQVRITGSIADQCVDYEAKGNALSEQLTAARKMKLPLFKERIPMEYNYNALGQTAISDKEYWERRKENDGKYTVQNIAYIRNHSDSHYAARLLLEIRDKKSAAALYEGLTDETKETYFGSIIGDMVNGWMITTPGLTFPNIIDRTLDGEPFELNKLRGRYVLLDFWGSWCGPCLAELPRLKEMQQLYDDTLEVIGIACNDNKERLIKTVESRGIHWTQLLDGPAAEKNYASRFGIRAFPSKLLLDTEGKIVKTYIGTDESLYDDINRLFAH